MPAAPIAEVTRRDVRTGRDVVESTHAGHVVVVGPDGDVAAALGDPARPTFVRSSVKPFQAAVSLEAAGALAGDLTDAEVAVGWASHRGEPRHLEAVSSICDRIGLASDELTTPSARPEAQPTLAARPLHYNCSGKHALFALAGRSLGVPRDRLLDPDGPLQRRMLAELEDVLGEVQTVGVDGCGAPAVQAPLAGLAHAFRRLWLDDRYARVRAAGLACPGLVGGEGRLDTALLGAGVLAKVGAEGVFGASWQVDGEVWGIAVKSEDGADRATAVALRDVLVAVGAIPETTWSPPPVLGGGEPQGHVRGEPALAELGRRL